MKGEKIRKEVYEELKIWDKKREQKLKKHLEIVEEILDNLENKIEDSNLYMASIEDLFKNRLKQLKTYVAKSLQNSEFVLPKNNFSAYQAHYNLLKAFVMDESLQVQTINEKINKLRIIYQQLSGFKQEQLSTEKKSPKDESSIVLERGNIRYMIECQLGEIVENVVGACEKVSKIYHGNEKEDLYLAILCLLSEAKKQAIKHREIGKQLISLINSTLKREKKSLLKIKQCLKEWVEIDTEIDPVFMEQLQKKDEDPLIKDFFDLSSMTDIVVRDSTVENFLTSFIIEEFEEFEKLRLCQLDGFFNKKIEANVIITADKFMHLLRLNSNTPDFSFMLNSGLCFQKYGESTVEVTQYRKKFYFKKEKQFSFELELNNAKDFEQLRKLALSISDCQFV